MSVLAIDRAAEFVSHLGGRLESLAESLSLCFDSPYRFALGESNRYDQANLPADFAGAGLAALFEIDGEACAILVPESLPLPDWFPSPSESQTARLETLVTEWGLNLFPDDQEPTRTAARRVSELMKFTQACGPADGATFLTVSVSDSAGQSHGRMLLVWPLVEAQFPSDVQPAASPPEKNEIPPEPEESEAGELDWAPAVPVDPLARLRKLPVQVSVRLAEKKITVSQLLTVTSGSLLTFNRSCEDLLDLYVNNAIYCRGEAVKIGENFGLKINQVGAAQETVPKILNG